MLKKKQNACEMSQSEIHERLKYLKCFKQNKQKSLFVCKCDDIVIIAICELVKGFIQNKFKIKNIKTIIKKLTNIKKKLRRLSDSHVSIKRKRQVLINFDVQTLLYPVLCKILIPFLEKVNY